MNLVGGTRIDIQKVLDADKQKIDLPYVWCALTERKPEQKAFMS